MRDNWIRVALVEDLKPLLIALEVELGMARGIQCCGSFETFDRAFKAIAGAKIFPDVVLMDISLPGRSGIEGCEILKRKWPRIKVLIFSGDDNQRTVLRAFAAGADGYLEKKAPREELAAAVESAHRGGFPMSEKVREAIARYQWGVHSLLPKLSPTEKEIFEEVEKGKSHKEIADLMQMSLHTVKTHLRRILEKHGAGSSLQVLAMRRSAAF